MSSINDNRQVIAAGIRWHRGITKLEIAEAIGDSKFVEWAKAQTFGGECSGCGLILKTEYDFAAHFTISYPDFINGYFNLGSCPNKNK